MMNEEKYIAEKVGKRNPFRVPEGYFDGFATQLMQSLPEQPQSSARSVRLRPLAVAAASVCVLVMCMAAYLLWPAPVSQDTARVHDAVYQVSGEASFEEAADYVMIDNQEIYACLAEN